MTTEQINMMIDTYFDGELEKSKEPILFTHLSLNEESRDYFKALNRVRNEIAETVEEFPQELEERILYSAASTEKKWFNLSFANNFPALFSYAAAIVLLLVSILFYTQSLSYKNTLESQTKQIENQNELIELFYNAMLPSVDVEAKLSNKVIINNEI